MAPDRVTAGTFYATSGTTLYLSTDGGATFASANTFTGKGAPRPVFGQAGEVWVAAGSLFRFTGAGATKVQIANVTNATGVGFGAPASGQTHPAVLCHRNGGGSVRLFPQRRRRGASWTRINDDAHQFGSLQGNYIGGDETHFGREFLTTGGRGYIYGDPN